ncbi:MAG: hypothetical protein ACFFED_11400 [Candidatus Thorarchaeota archaeon]
MYVKIRRDGAIGLGRGTEGAEEITLGYGEAHMIAAALDKLAQTARSYKQTYKKTTDVGKGNKIDFERAEDGSIIIAGDGQRYICTEKQVRELSEVLKHLPPVEVAPPSDYVNKTRPNQGFCLVLQNGGNSIPLMLHEAALLKTSVNSSIGGKFYKERIKIGGRDLMVERSSDLKWKISSSDQEVKFTAFEVEGLIQGLHNGVLDVLMDLVKSFGSDSLADIRVKSHIQRVEQETAKLFQDDKSGKGLAKSIVKSSRKIIGTGEDAESRTLEFIDLCNYVHASVNPEHHETLFKLFSSVFVPE